MVYEKFEIQVSKNTIARTLEKFHYTLKNIVRVPVRRNNSDTIEIRYQYADRFRNYESSVSDKNFIFIDEIGFQVVTRKKRGDHLKEHLLISLSVPQEVEIFQFLRP